MAWSFTMHLLEKNKHLFILRLLQVAAATVFLGRAWQHLVWDAPFRTLLWDERWMSSVVEGVFQIPWQEYITSPVTDQAIQNLIICFGVFYLLCFLMVFLVEQWQKIAGMILLMGSFSLLLLALLYCKERFFSVGQFLEYSLQFLSPLFLYMYVKQRRITPRLMFWMKVAIAFTFVCHGLYAIGYYPRPGYFVEMTMLCTGWSETTAIQLLKVAGILDFVIGIGIFLPARYARWIVAYAVLWGLLTTLARVVSYVDWAYLAESAKQWVHESVYRIPHFVIPFIVLYHLWNSEKEKSNPGSQDWQTRRSAQIAPEA